MRTLPSLALLASVALALAGAAGAQQDNASTTTDNSTKQTTTTNATLPDRLHAGITRDCDDGGAATGGGSDGSTGDASNGTTNGTTDAGASTNGTTVTGSSSACLDPRLLDAPDGARSVILTLWNNLTAPISIDICYPATGGSSAGSAGGANGTSGSSDRAADAECERASAGAAGNDTGSAGENATGGGDDNVTLPPTIPAGGSAEFLVDFPALGSSVHVVDADTGDVLGTIIAHEDDDGAADGGVGGVGGTDDGTTNPDGNMDDGAEEATGNESPGLGLVAGLAAIGIAAFAIGRRLRK